MRRFEESQKSDFERNVKLGRDNAEYLRQMGNWCKHVEVGRVSEGLYAQMTGLPIAMHSIGCPHIENELQSMNLRWIFTDFLVQHCTGCVHHAPNGSISWGQKIINSHIEELQKHEQEAREKANQISQFRSDLRSKSRIISTEAEPESHRILEFLETVFSEDEAERINAAEQLKQSAHLGADLFPGAAIDLILVLAGSDEFCRLILPICAELAIRRTDLSTRLSNIALDNIKKELNVELSASVLNALGNTITYPLDEVSIKKLLLLQSHYRPFGGWEDNKHSYTHSTAILVMCFDAEPQSVQRVICQELEAENDITRVQLCGALRLIQKERPQIAVNLLDNLIKSLKLYEDEHMGTQTPSGQIIHILRSAFQQFPNQVDQYLANSMASVRPAVQEDIISVYRNQFIDWTVSFEERRENKNRAEVSECEKVAIQRLLTWAKDDRLEIDIRARALESLKIACNYATAGVLIHFDSLLGYYAIISAEEHPPNAPPKILLLDHQETHPQLKQLNEFSHIQQWGIFKQSLQECLEEICESRPIEVFDSISECLNQPLEHLNEGFKACCVSLLGEIGKEYQLRPRVLPLVWRALMDYNSAWVRAVAINATVEMFSFFNATPPANLVDTIIIHLQDPIVAVHKAAVQAVSWRPSWFDEKQSLEVLTCLASHLRVYRNNNYQLDDICDGILAIGRRFEHLKFLAVRMVETIFPTGEELVDSKIAESLMRFCKPNEPIAHFVAKDIAKYLGQHDRDRYNHYGHSARVSMFEWLCELPPETYQITEEDLLVSAKKMAERDAWESCHFASLFSHFRAFQLEHIVLETAVNALPEEPKYIPFQEKLQKFAMIAAGNAALQAGELEMAKTYFSKGKEGA